MDQFKEEFGSMESDVNMELVAYCMQEVTKQIAAHARQLRHLDEKGIIPQAAFMGMLIGAVKRLFLHQSMFYGSPERAVEEAHRLIGPLDPEQLKADIEALLNESLGESEEPKATDEPDWTWS